MSPRRTQSKSAGIVALLVLFSVLSYFNRTIMSIAGPDIMKEFALSETETGAIYSAFLLGYAVCMIPGGKLSDRFGPRLVITLMALGTGLFTALTALGGRPGLGAYLGIVPAFLVIRLALGTATAPLYPACAKMNANWHAPSERARVWGWIASGAGIGGAVSPMLFSAMAQRYGWRTSFWIAGLVTAAAGVAWYFRARDYPQQAGSANPEDAGQDTPWRSLLTSPDLMLLSLGYFAVAYFEYIFFYWLYYYFGEIRKMGMEQSAVYTTAMWLAWTVMTPAGGWVTDKLVLRYGVAKGRRLVPMVGLTLSAILLCIGVNLTEPPAIAALMCLALGFASSSDAAYWTSAMEAGGKHVGAACGILNTGGNLGGFLAPMLTAYIASRFGWSSGLYVGAFIVILAVFTWPFIDSEKRRLRNTISSA